MVISRYVQLPCQHPFTIATYSLYEHRRRHIISCLFRVFNWNICLCHCQKYLWSARSVRGVSAYPECSGIISNFKHLYVFPWSAKKLIHNYIGLNFPRNSPFLWKSCFQTWWEEVKKTEALRIMQIVRQTGGNGHACAQRETCAEGEVEL
jgi:hypothetical protein